MSRVVLAMSGGVDSSVAAWLLREQGHDVIGLFMRHGQQPATSCDTRDSDRKGGRDRKGDRSNLPERPEGCFAQIGPVPFSVPFFVPNVGSPRKQGCCSEADAADARRVAELLDIPFYAVNFKAEFGRIVDYFVEEYLSAKTPNPCIVCNTWLKFGKLIEYADSVNAQFVASGHYARLTTDEESTEPELRKGCDETKDQSYVLFGIERRLLPRVMFPVGEHQKEEIRRIAAQLDLRVADKRDSQEICFVPDQDHARFIREHLIAQGRPKQNTAGEFVTTDGTVVGRHDGFERFTVGQRKGLGIALGDPHYVVRIEPDTCRVVLGTRDELACDELTAGGANWLCDEPTEPLRCQVKIRYRSRPVDATVEVLGQGRFHAKFDEPCHGVAPGQAAVCYQGDRVLGGGWIE